MQDILREAQMSAGNLYRYFPSKDAIVLAIVEATLAEVTTAFERTLLDEPPTLMQALTEILRAIERLDTEDGTPGSPSRSGAKPCATRRWPRSSPMPSLLSNCGSFNSSKSTSAAASLQARSHPNIWQASGKLARRPELDKALLVLREGDQLVVTKLDRLGRSLEHLVALSKQLQERNVDGGPSPGAPETVASGGMTTETISSKVPPAARPRRRRWVSALIWILAAPFTAWAALRVTGWDAGFRWIQLVAFTPYVAAASVVVALLALSLRRWAASVVSLVVVGAFAVAVLPRTFADAAPSPGGAPLRVLAANLARGEADTKTLMDLVTGLKPDILTLQELTPDAAGRLEKAGIRKLLPHMVGEPTPGVWGSGIYARFPLRADQAALKYGNFRQSLAVVPELNLEIASVHPCAPRFDYKATCWAQGLRALPKAGAGPYRVLAGDFNATLDHAIVRELLGTGYRDAADATGQGLTPTWPQQGWEPVPGVTLDHVFADSRIAIRSFGVHRVPGTDHRAVFAELELPRKAR
ncbi:endonuclease/exonuclease/phosphatase family protein [Streptosporangium sp. CA-135522]|uniref:endonuclease/exonuclease/phosphatase family protein n=1 Tax=Streptosporangium sp. CA-135522 TaxID=3240072 RepID=UPI003D8E43EE